MGKNIKIFVSHRIDLDSVVIDNPLYIPVYCGSIFKKSDRDNSIVGDDTGDNISEKRCSFCEFTVQYWVWKNIKADYYGLCHYRRYLSFADEYIEFNDTQHFAIESALTSPIAAKYNLLNEKKIRKEIAKYDVITSMTYPVEGIDVYPKARNEKELWLNHPGFWISEEDIELTLNIIKELFPQYYEIAMNLMSSDEHRGYNLFIMKKKYFFEMCEFEFGVLFELERRMEHGKNVGNKERIFGYLGEILYGTYMNYLKNSLPNTRFCEKQIVYFHDTDRKRLVSPVKKASLKERIKYKFFPERYLTRHIVSQLDAQNAAVEMLKQQIWDVMENVKKVEKRTHHMYDMEKINYQTHALPFGEIDESRFRFWASYPKASGSLRIIQKGNDWLLAEMMNICNKLQIKFWLHGGSLVGALRHKGCVPWDDDIDVAMMRDDFRKFREYINENEYDFEIGEYYYYGLGCRAYRFKKRGGLPFFVDVFIYDFYKCKQNVVDDWKMLRKYHQAMQRQMLMIVSGVGGIFDDQRLDDKPELKKKIDDLIDSYINRVAMQDGDYVLWGLDNNYENESRFAWHNGRLFAKEDIFPLKRCEYEDMMCYIPANYKKYVVAEYGIGYLDMPDTIDRAIHYNQYFKEVDISQSYKILTGYNFKE